MGRVALVLVSVLAFCFECELGFCQGIEVAKLVCLQMLNGWRFDRVKLSEARCFY